MNTAIAYKFITERPKVGDRIVTDVNENFGIVQEVSEPMSRNSMQEFVRVRYIECDTNFVPLEPFLGYKWTTKTVNTDADVFV